MQQATHHDGGMTLPYSEVWPLHSAATAQGASHLAAEVHECLRCLANVICCGEYLRVARVFVRAPPEEQAEGRVHCQM